MGRGQRIDYMIKTVLPSERQAFAGFDARRFARLDCESCHGEGVGRGVFTMPNPALPKLDPDGDFARHRAAAPEMTRFMAERVLPATASLLELPPQSDASPTGLGCLSCHTREAGSGAPAWQGR
jgi:hypothetical protein